MAGRKSVRVPKKMANMALHVIVPVTSMGPSLQSEAGGLEAGRQHSSVSDSKRSVFAPKIQDVRRNP